MAVQVGDKIKATCTDKQQNAWKIDEGGDAAGEVRFIREDGTAYVFGINGADFVLTIAPPTSEAPTVAEEPS